MNGRHAGQRRPDRRPGPGEPDDGALVQHLHADHGRRAPELRQRVRAAGVPDPRRERARHDRGAARRRHTAASRSTSTCRSSRRSALHGRPNFQMRVEMFNAFNGVQWGNPNTTITTAQFGRDGPQPNDPRSIQLAVPGQLLRRRGIATRPRSPVHRWRPASAGPRVDRAGPSVASGFSRTTGAGLNNSRTTVIFRRVAAMALLFVASLEARADTRETIPRFQEPAGKAAEATPRKFYKEWKMDDLLPSVKDLGAGHDWSQGRELFKKAACGVCHAFASESEGTGLAPDLTPVGVEVHARLHPAVHSRAVRHAQRPVLPHHVHAEERRRDHRLGHRHRGQEDHRRAGDDEPAGDGRDCRGAT